MGEDDCIPSCNEVSYKITATSTAKFPGTGAGIETGTDADFTRAARNLLSNLTKNLNHRYKKYGCMTKMFLLAGVFYNVKNGSSFIMSKSESKNLSNENKHWCFLSLRKNVH